MSPADVVFDELAREATDWTSDLGVLKEGWGRAGGEVERPARSRSTSPLHTPQIIDENAEVSTVASLLAQPRPLEQIVDWLRLEHFTRHDMRTRYAAITVIAAAVGQVDRSP